MTTRNIDVKKTRGLYDYLQASVKYQENIIDRIREDNSPASEVFSNLAPVARTPEVCWAAVAKNGLALRYIEKPSKELVETALRQNGMALKHVPPSERNFDWCLIAVRQTGKAIDLALESEDLDVDKFIQKRRMQTSRDPRAVDIDPAHTAESIRQHRAELITTALNTNALAIQYLPNAGPECCEQALRAEPEVIRLLSRQQILSIAPYVAENWEDLVDLVPTSIQRQELAQDVARAIGMTVPKINSSYAVPRGA